MTIHSRFGQLKTACTAVMILVIIIASVAVQKPSFIHTAEHQLAVEDADLSTARSQTTDQRERASTPPATTVPTVAPTHSPTAAPVSAEMTSAELATWRPDEMGRIPVLMYHAFTRETQYLDEWTLLPEQFEKQLEWLYDHEFYVMSMADLVNNEISVPPGKHPVVLTFDDSSSGQFRLIKDDHDQLVPDPESAVGVMEAFFAAHPDFGHTAFFAIVPINCFSYPEEIVSCEDRLLWLADHGYEMGNHTWYHQDLSQASDELLEAQVGDTKIWLDQRVPGLANLSNVLVLPFGAGPATNAQFSMLQDGFDWDGQHIQMVAVVTVNGGPSPSPSGNQWSRWSIARYSSEPDTFAYWAGQIESGALTLYTSDGGPASITVPDPIPADVADQFDPEIEARQGMDLVRYTPGPPPSPVPEGTPARVILVPGDERRWQA